MCALPSAVRPSAGGVPRRTAAAPSDASERASSGKKRPRDSSACLTKMTRTSNNVVTAAGRSEKSSQEPLQKRLPSELDAVCGLLKKAELVSRCGACKGGAPIAAGKKEPFLDPKQRPKPIEDAGGNAPSVKRRKISTRVEQQKFAEESKDDRLGDESKGEVVLLEQESKGDTGKIIGASARRPSEPASATAQSTAEAESVSGEDTGVPVYYIRPNKPVFVRPVIDMAGLIYKGKLRRQQLEMERAALPDQSIHTQRLGISR